MLILIPAYKPDSSLLELISNLNSQAQQEGQQEGQKLSILLVNDGSGPAYDPLFAQAKEIGQALADLHILTLPENGGKGAALRAGISWAQKQAPGQVIISADADGQHLPADILALGRETEKAAEEGQKSLLLGVRTLEDPQAPQQKVPLRSRVGNALTAFLFGLSTGQKVADTQTGLRGFTPQILPWLLKVPGDRYEYEFNMLLRAQPLWNQPHPGSHQQGLRSRQPHQPLQTDPRLPADLRPPARLPCLKFLRLHHRHPSPPGPRSARKPPAAGSHRS